MEWINNLSAKESPAWSGLPHNAEKILKQRLAQYGLSKVSVLQDSTEEEVNLDTVDIGVKKTGSIEGQLQWIKELGQRVAKYLEILPKGLEKLERVEGSLSNPLFRFLEREVTVASKLLNQVRTNLSDTKSFCEGKIQSTSGIRELIKVLHVEEVPSGWKKYTIGNMKLNDWISDFKKRLDQFAVLISSHHYHKKGVWLGGLIFPEAYLTAMRQFVAQNNKWSLEELELSVSIYNHEQLENDSFLISGMTIAGAKWDLDQKEVRVTNDVNKALPKLVFKWVKNDKIGHELMKETEIIIPVYLNRTRKNLMFSMKLECEDGKRSELYQRGIAFIACDS